MNGPPKAAAANRLLSEAAATSARATDSSITDHQHSLELLTAAASPSRTAAWNPMAGVWHGLVTAAGKGWREDAVVAKERRAPGGPPLDSVSPTGAVSNGLLREGSPEAARK